MNCPLCSNKLEIFARDGKEIYVCPFCLSGLLPDESSAKIIKYFCGQEIIERLLSGIMDDSLFENTEKMLSPGKNVMCPKCELHAMEQHDMDKRLKFHVLKCKNCGYIFLNQMQMPLVALAFLENTPQDMRFKNIVEKLYEYLAGKKSKEPRNLNDIMAPFLAISGALLPIPGVVAMPTGDLTMRKTKPIATLILIFFCVMVFILQNESTVWSFAMIPEKALSGEWYRMLTSVFLHGSISHLLGNMYFLWIFGRTLDDGLGWKKYLPIFIVGGIVANIFHMATVMDKDIPALGASGAISAVVGAYLILFPKLKIRISLVSVARGFRRAVTSVPGWYYIIGWTIMNLFFILLAGNQNAPIGYWAHIGGIVTGIVFAEIYKNLKRE